MKYKPSLAVVIASTLLAGCTVQRTANGGYALNSESLGQMIQGPSANPTPNQVVNYQSTSSPQSADVERIRLPAKISFHGVMEGGKGSVDLTALGHEKYHVGLEVEGYNGSGVITGYGTVVGIAYRNGNTFVMHQGYYPSRNGTLSGSPDVCDITMQLKNSGHSMDVIEKNCSAWHGADVSFNGILHRVN